MDYIIVKDVEYTISETNLKGNFCWDWDEHCEVEPETEHIFEDVVGNEYVIYKNFEGDIIGEFSNDG
jgi:hypothetical protein